MFWIILIAGVVLYFVLKGKRDRPEQLGAAHRPMTTGALEPHKFPCPYAKCQACGGSGEGMKQEWDGLRSVKWTCGYCGAQAGVQELKDEELPPSARRRLGLDAPPMAQGGVPMQGGYGGGGGVGDLLTGMMIGSMMGGGGHHQDRSDDSGWGGGDSGGGSSDWGDSGGSDWGDSGGGDSGGDWGGGDSGGGDSGGDW
ncbi:MAG TPA: hypothetical protein VF768_00275 [Holophagaceae bacterium]